MKLVRIVKLIVRTSKFYYAVSTTYTYLKGQWTLHTLHFNIFHASDTVSLRDTIIKRSKFQRYFAVVYMFLK